LIAWSLIEPLKDSPCGFEVLTCSLFGDEIYRCDVLRWIRIAD